MSQRYIGGLIYNPPGGFSGYFDGSGDYLSLAANSAFDITSGNFTVEAWILRTTSGVEQYLFSNRLDSPSSQGWEFRINATNLLSFFFTGGSIITSSGTVPANAWTHVAVSRQTNTVRLFINGALDSSATFSNGTPASGTGLYLGYGILGGGYLTGFMSNARIVKGTAVYTAAFDPPVGPLQAITNTSLLTCAYPTFRDGSSNNFTITVNGNTAVSTQNPFPQTQLPNPALGNQGNGVYSMSQYQALRSQNLWPAIDQYWPYVTMMLHGNGTNGAQNNTFLDSSTNNFTITRNGNTTQGTFTPYGSLWCNYFGGSSSDYIAIADNNALDFGTGDFTIEFWFNFAVSQDRAIATGWNTSGVVNGWAVDASNTGVSFTSAVNDSYVGASQSGSILNGVWNHFAAVRSGSTVTVYLNGVGGTPVTNTQSINTQSSGMMIGRSTYNPNPRPYQGYVSNFRILKGTALYTANFTPSASPLTAITNTSLLTCQSNRFIDNSSNAFTVTPNGNVSVQRFSPFAPTTPYAAGTIGGSGYFDGSGDWLSAGAASNWTFLHNGASDWTIQFWVYYSGTSQYGIISTTAFSAQNGMSVFLNSTNDGGSVNGVKVFISRGDGQNYIVFNSSAVLVQNAWNYVAITFTSSTKTCAFTINGASAGSSSNTGFSYSSSSPSFPLSIGRYDGTIPGGYFPGYLADTRISNTVRSSLTTVPSAPLASDGNTNLLLSYTNAGIIDNAMMNDLETVGNAQISTSVSKFGGGSLAFDGTDDRLTAPASPNLAFNTGDFTVEGWIYTGSTGNLGVFQISGTAGGLQANQTNNTAVYCNNLVLGAYYGGTFKTGTTPIAANTWTHFALVRSSSVTRLYVNGVLDSGFGSNSDTQNYTGQNICVGGYFGTSNLFNGNIDDFRVTRGYARYTANFTPQRSQWQDQ